MWEKLLGLFKETYGDNINDVVPSNTRQQLSSQVPETQSEINSPIDKGSLIGYNYLKGMNDKNNVGHTRRFINLNKLLRGRYNDGKIETTHGEPEENIRRKNS